MNAFINFMPLVLVLVIFYFLLIRPQKKREKAVNQMRSSVQVGDEVVTIGGICGKIVKTKDDTLVIQVGADKVKFEIMRWAVSKVVESSVKPSGKKEKDEVAEEEAPKKALPKRMRKNSTTTEETTETTVKEEVVEAAEVVEVPEEMGEAVEAEIVEAEIVEPEKKDQ